MIPEAALVAVLLIVFFADMFMGKSGEKKNKMLGLLTGILMLVPLAACALAAPTEAFGGLYVTSSLANSMKAILTAGNTLDMLLSSVLVLGNGFFVYSVPI